MPGYTGRAKRAGWSLRFYWRGKSGLHRAGGWVTPRRREATESATETTPPMGPSKLGPQARVKRCGKSAPGSGASRDAGKPLPEQGQIEGCLRFFGGRCPTASPGRPHDSFRQREDQIDDHRPGPPGYRIRLTGPLGRPSSQPLPAVGGETSRILPQSNRAGDLADRFVTGRQPERNRRATFPL